MLGVKLEISRAAVTRGIDASVVERRLSAAVAHRLATEIRERVQDRADLGGQAFPGWSTRPRWLATSPGYPDRAQGRVGSSGAEFYRPASAYHRANSTVPGAYSTTGGMWSGLSAVVQSERVTNIDFRGRSIGRDPAFVRKGVTKRRKTAYMAARTLKVNNVLKAWTVLAKHKINVLALSQGEFEAIARVTLYAMAMGASATLPIDWPTPVPGTLGEIVARSFGGSL